MPGRPTALSPFYRVSIALMLVCGVIAAGAVYRDARRTEEQRLQVEFSRRAALRHALTREVLARYTESLFGLSALFSLNSEVSYEEFVRATRSLGDRLPGTVAFEWVPYVPAEARSEFEAKMHALFPQRGFHILQFDLVGRPRPAPTRAWYFPIAYIQPLAGNEIALGYDLMTAPSRPFLERARDTRHMQVTGPLRLIQENANVPGVIIIWPVFRPTAHAAPGEAGRASAAEVFAGFVQCVFRVRPFLETASKGQADDALEMLFVDATEPNPASRVLYYRPAAGAATGALPTLEDFRRGAPFTEEFPLPVGERDWRVVYRPHPAWIASQATPAPLYRAGTVLLVAALLTGLVVITGRRAATIQSVVTERTAELAESRRQFANLLHALPGMAYRARYDDKLELIFASEGALAITGWPAEDFIQQAVHLRDLIHPDDLPRVRAETRAALDGHKDIEVEYRLRTRSGEEKWVLSRGRGVFDQERRLEAVEGLVIDITEAKRTEGERLAIERKLLETQKLESLGLMAGGVAHDFNNLLSAILGNASLARMSLPQGNVADPQLRAIETASLRAAELCRQMLAYAGKGRFVIERVDLSALIEDLLPLLHVSLGKTVRLQLALSRDLPGIKADATQLRQIVMNLVLNAVDALAGQPGEISIRTRVTPVDQPLLASCVTGAGLPTGDYVCLEISDTGCGMEPEVLAKIFDPFFTTKFAGRGLGLAAVLGIVRGHNGAMCVESSAGRGSTFQLYLPPIAGEPMPSAEAPASTATSQHSGHVLVVDDEDAVRAVLVATLSAFGFTAEAVADGAAAVARFSAEPDRWRMVVIDLLMPGMSGEETLTALQAIKPDVRVLLISGFTEGEVIDRVRRHRGQVAFLAKPFRHDAFDRALRELLA